MQSKKSFTIIIALIAVTAIVMIRCSDKKDTTPAPVVQTYGGYNDKVKWGEHLVSTIGCGDCHTPKKMSAMGPVDDSALSFSGHPEHMPIPDIDRKMVESKGLAVTNTLTAWVGPWGVSYAANISSDSTSGIGGWTLTNFITALRFGKKSGVSTARDLLPPMPWQSFKNLTDDELDAMLTYLQTTKPIHNNVPAAMPPVTAMSH